VDRDPRHARVLGLWTAGWLAVFLVVGMVRLGEPSVQWPVLAVPLLWALVALRPRRRRGAREAGPQDGGWDGEREWDGEQGWDGDEWDGDDGWGDPEAVDEPADRWADRWGEDPDDARRGPRIRPAERTDTVERPAVRRPEDDDPWSGRRRP
jgi:hypothetical protein